MFKQYFDIAGQPGRFPGLDNIRAIAIILVLLRHSVRFWEEPLDGAIWNLWYNGWLGVDLFFALSGFLITHHLLSKWPKSNYRSFIYSYFFKRALRILPLYTFIVLIALLGIIPFFQPDYPITPYALLIHAVFLQDYIPFASIVVSLWSLGVEEKFYLIAPVLVYCTQKYSSTHVLACCAIVIIFITVLRVLVLLDITDAISYTDFFWTFRAPFHFSIVGVLSGAVIALLYSKYQLSLLSPRWNKVLQYLSIIILLLILMVERWIEAEHWIFTGVIITLCSILFAIILYCALSITSSSESPINKLLRFIAKLAYPLYLIHLMIVPMVKVVCSSVFASQESVPFVAYFTVYLVLSLCAAIILHLLVEKPFLILKSRIQ
ncbi:acyltransferase family protein [Rheinheimera sp. WS51]|uniref:acyltransferase family protein n=1 Tax=Rheinheimera sp. WS51 TaxID=3425886 RepID=UPI003D8C1C14